MRRMARVLVIALALSFAFVGPASAEGSGGANNVVLVSNTGDGSMAARDQVQIAHDASDSVRNANIASASGHDCTGCRTVAVAMQVVLVERSDPSDVQPANVAAASNGNCTSCTTYAFAYQYVVQPGRMVYLSADAQQRMRDLRAEVDAETCSTDDYAAMSTALDQLFGEIVQTITDNVQNAGMRSDGATTVVDHEQAG